MASLVRCSGMRGGRDRDSLSSVLNCPPISPDAGRLNWFEDVKRLGPTSN